MFERNHKFSSLINTLLVGKAALICLLFCGVVRAESQTNDTAELVVENHSANGLEFGQYYDYQLFTLKNGLRVLVHEDSSASNTTVAVYAHVGSKDEPQGKSGFAHLYEHLLFNGTRRNPGEYFKYIDEIGGVGANGSTSWDVTNYFESVPRESLERMLWLEADRMANVANDVSLQSIKTQIDVVKNEKNLSENEDFGSSEDAALRTLYPAGHPYSHSVIGSVEDLESASLDDVKRWYGQYYGAQNTVLGLSGNITVEDAKALTAKYFSHLEPGPSLNKISDWFVPRPVNTVQVNYDNASNSQLVRTYLLPPSSQPNAHLPVLAMQIFASGETSVLYRELVDEQGIATDVDLMVDRKELDTSVTLQVTPKKGVTLEELAQSLDQAFAAYLKKSPSRSDIELQYGAQRSYILEEVGRPDYKILSLIEGELMYGSALYQLQLLQAIAQTKPQQVKRAANKYLSVGYHEQRNIAVPARSAIAQKVDLDVAPKLAQQAAAKMPESNVFELPNGLKVVHIERANAPEITMSLSIPQGRAHLPPKQTYQFDLMQGVMNEEGVAGLSADELSRQLEQGGINLSVGVDTDYTRLNLSVSSMDFDQGFKLWAALASNAQFKQASVERHVADSLDQFEVDKEDVGLAAENEVFNKVLEGSANFVSLVELSKLYKDVTSAQLSELYRSLFKPNGATLYVVGDISQSALKQNLADGLKGWEGEVQQRAVIKRDYPAQPTTPRFILVDDIGANQTQLLAVKRLSELSNRDYYLESVANSIVGGSFTSRINLNIRESKGWTYGIGSELESNSLYDQIALYSNVTGAYTVDAIKEIERELTESVTTKPISSSELLATKTALMSSFSSQLSSNSELLQLLQLSDHYGQDYRYFDGYVGRHKAVSLDQVRGVSNNLFDPQAMTWLLVGDLANFEENLREAKLGSVEVYDLEARRIR